MALDVGSRLAHYNVTVLIGEGGMGQVPIRTSGHHPLDASLRQFKRALTQNRKSRLNLMMKARFWSSGYRSGVNVSRCSL